MSYDNATCEQPLGVKHMRRRFILIVPLLILFAGSAFGETGQRIQFLRCIITVRSDGTVLTKEIFKIAPNGNAISHGIVKDFLSRYQDANGKWVVSAFNLESVRRDGKDEPYTTDPIADGIRLYTGNKNVFLPKGAHTYEISYLMTKQIETDGGIESITRNVVGKNHFPIEAVKVAVRLPQNIPGDKMSLNIRSKGKSVAEGDFQTIFMDNGRILFKSVRPLESDEDLSITVGWRKGGIATSVDGGSRVRDWVNEGDAVKDAAVACLLCITFMCFLIAWLIAGRDAQGEGSVATHFAPPTGVSPAMARYIMVRRADNVCMTAAIMNMTVKGYLEQSEGGRGIVRVGSDTDNLTAEERAWAHEAFATSDYLDTTHRVVDQYTAQRFQGSTGAFRQSLATGGRNYIRSNFGYFLPGCVFSIVTLFAAMGNIDVAGDTFVVSIGFTALIIRFLFMTTRHMMRRYPPQDQAEDADRGSPSRRPRLRPINPPFEPAEVSLFGDILSGIIITAAGACVFRLIWSNINLVTALAMVGAVTLIIIFRYQMRSMTPLGAQMVEDLEGFRRFLGNTNRDRFANMNPPEITADLYNRYMAYAYVLGVQEHWTWQLRDAQTGERVTEESPVEEEKQPTPVVDAGDRVDINNADEKTIAELPGVGIILAKRIIAERKQRAGFKTMDELAETADLPEYLRRQLRNRIEFGGYAGEILAATGEATQSNREQDGLDINNESEEAIAEALQIKPDQAKRVVTERKNRGGFKSMEELSAFLKFTNEQTMHFSRRIVFKPGVDRWDDQHVPRTVDF